MLKGVTNDPFIPFPGRAVGFPCDDTAHREGLPPPHTLPQNSFTGDNMSNTGVILCIISLISAFIVVVLSYFRSEKKEMEILMLHEAAGLTIDKLKKLIADKDREIDRLSREVARLMAMAMEREK